jgi:hypothetical protein
MNQLARFDERLNNRKQALFQLLEAIGGELDLNQSRREDAETRYTAVSSWLIGSDDPRLKSTSVFLAGSTAIGTNVRPLSGEEHDVDLMSVVLGLGADSSPSEVKALIGRRLRENARYAEILEEMTRCWRIVYANEFHLDITPAIRNPNCPHGGLLVPDKELRRWKPSHPKGFRDRFDGRALLVPRFRMTVQENALVADRGSVEPYPAYSPIKGVLRRTTQLLKRHRDVYFDDKPDLSAPISIAITELAARAYEYLVKNHVFDNEFDLLLHIVKMMPVFIDERPATHGKWAIWNHATQGENFAEKWNRDQVRADAFFQWQRVAEAGFGRLVDFEGRDAIAEELRLMLGARAVNKVLDDQTGEITAARDRQRLWVAPKVGLVTASSGFAAAPVRANTFFGRKDADPS